MRSSSLLLYLLQCLQEKRSLITFFIFTLITCIKTTDMNRILSVIAGLLSMLHCFSQTIPVDRLVDWSVAGLADTSTMNFTVIDMTQYGVVGDGVTPNDGIMDNILATIFTPGVVFKFPAGNFLFNSTIQLPSKTIIKGEGADATLFTMDLGGAGHAITMQGNAVNSDTTAFLTSGLKNDSTCTVYNTSLFQVGDWVRLIQDDTDWVTSSWAENRVGQVVQINAINNQEITFSSAFRMDYDNARSPYLMKINPVENSGVECLKVLRVDDTAPEQSSSIFFNYAANCWVLGVESENCTFSHIGSYFSSNLTISQSYFHHAFGYGGGGRAYGVMLQSTTNECLIENNVFEHLRHSMILQSGANGNVFAYNYSFDPFWESTPSNSAGDMVLHGNYPFSNLFEGNICQNIVIDNSHGPNGPHNLIFRNRAEGYGIFFSATNSPNQTIVGNEIPNTNFPYNLVNYTIQGANHFLFGNNNKGSIDPVGTDVLNDTSYAYMQKPAYLNATGWFGIGVPNQMNQNVIPAFQRTQNNIIMENACTVPSLSIQESEPDLLHTFVSPNPFSDKLTLKVTKKVQAIDILNSTGTRVFETFVVNGYPTEINTRDWKKGVYFVRIHTINKQAYTLKLIKLYE